VNALAVATRALRAAGVLVFAAALCACAVLPGHDPLRVAVVDIDAIDGQGLEFRLAITLRVQNPNDTAVEFDGASLELVLDGRTLATGVSDRRGTVPRYGETLMTVPVSVSALGAMRQAMALADGPPRDALPYVLRGKLSTGAFGGVRFTQEGTLAWGRLEKRAK
jgi:LEA14-like dessication related protein